VSMKDIYRHPTIRSLAAALADAAPKPVQPPGSAAIEAATSTSAREYILCGALQALFFLAYSYLAVVGIAWSSRWVASGSSAAEACGRLVLASSAAFLLASAVPIAAKWVLIGRWKTQRIRLWSLAYVRFWIVKTLIRSSPAARMFIGTPVYLLYLRALGARIGPGAVIFSRRVPVCTDLLTIGAGTVIRKEALFQCYRAQAGRLELGPVTLGRDVFVGERSVLDINTSMGDRAQLGHASGLHSGQAVPAGERWHGSPAQRTDVNYLRGPSAPASTWRQAGRRLPALRFSRRHAPGDRADWQNEVLHLSVRRQLSHRSLPAVAWISPQAGRADRGEFRHRGDAREPVAERCRQRHDGRGRAASGERRGFEYVVPRVTRSDRAS